MTGTRTRLVLAAAIGLSVFGMTAARAWDTVGGDHNAYVQTNLVSNGTIPARTTDTDLRNAWGIAFFPGGPFWIADNATGLSTLYDGAGTKSALTVTIPPPPQGTLSAPTGIVANVTAQFQVPGTSLPGLFIFDTEDGTISVWNPGLPDRTKAVLAVDNSGNGTGAVYKGLAFATSAKGNFLYATNFRAGTIDVFDGSFKSVQLDNGAFTDPELPPNYAPFGIRNIDGDLFVTFALQNAEKHDDVAGPGNGFVDVFDAGGHLLRRFAAGGTLNSPWGLARAPFGFGPFSGAILVGDFGDGRINAFDDAGNLLGQLQDRDGQPIVIDGLWSLTFGGAANSDADTLYVTAGPNDEKDGLFAAIVSADRVKAEAASN